MCKLENGKQKFKLIIIFVIFNSGQFQLLLIKYLIRKYKSVQNLYSSDYTDKCKLLKTSEDCFIIISSPKRFQFCLYFHTSTATTQITVTSSNTTFLPYFHKLRGKINNSQIL